MTRIGSAIQVTRFIIPLLHVISFIFVSHTCCVQLRFAEVFHDFNEDVRARLRFFSVSVFSFAVLNRVSCCSLKEAQKVLDDMSLLHDVCAPW